MSRPGGVDSEWQDLLRRLQCCGMLCVPVLCAGRIVARLEQICRTRLCKAGRKCAAPHGQEP